MQSTLLLNETKTSKGADACPKLTKTIGISSKNEELASVRKSSDLSPTGDQRGFINPAIKHQKCFTIRGRNISIADLRELEIIGILYNCRLVLQYAGGDDRCTLRGRESAVITTKKDTSGALNYTSLSRNRSLRCSFEERILPLKTTFFTSEKLKLSNSDPLKLLSKRQSACRGDQARLAIHFQSPDYNQASWKTRPFQSGIVDDRRYFTNGLQKSKSVDKCLPQILRSRFSEDQSDSKNFDHTLITSLERSCSVQKVQSVNVNDSWSDDNLDESFGFNLSGISKITKFSETFQKFGSKVSHTNRQLCKSIVIQALQTSEKGIFPEIQEEGASQEKSCRSGTDSGCNVKAFHPFSLFRL